MPRSYTAKSAPRKYLSRSQKIEKKRTRRATRARLRTPAQEQERVAYRVKLLERGLANWAPRKEAEDESEKPAA